VHFDFRGVELFATMPGKCALDLTGSSGCTLWTPHIIGVDCAIGLLEARPEDDQAMPETSGRARVSRTIVALQLEGVFSLAAYYNCAAEESKIYGGNIEAQAGKYATFWSRQIHPEDREAVLVATPHSTPGNANSIVRGGAVEGPTLSALHAS
jgi:hypothetical protein